MYGELSDLHCLPSEHMGTKCLYDSLLFGKVQGPRALIWPEFTAMLPQVGRHVVRGCVGGGGTRALIWPEFTAMLSQVGNLCVWGGGREREG